MFLLVLNEPQARVALSRPRLTLLVGLLVFVPAVLLGGFSPYLLAAFALPLLEFRLARNHFLQGRRFGVALAAVAVLIAHAAFLGFMQLEASGAQRLAVTLAYTSAILVGAVGGLLLFGLDAQVKADSTKAGNGGI
jgi:hypothetical protein